ncbi:MAG: DUF4179 domain-containing protein [Clostridia bacterium]|nr:DUF4179 domain-containing protein [Clostridia bacterium]
MKDIEKILYGKKIEYDQLEAPEELEMRLKNALKDRHKQTRPGKQWKAVLLVSMVTFLIMANNFDIFAYYGKKLFGYERLMNSTLANLNQMEKGQSIEKSQTLKNGITITLDGIMLDDNQLIAFFTVKDPKGRVDEFNLGPQIYFRGFFGRYDFHGAGGELNAEKTEAKYMAEFDPPFFLEKTLNFGTSIIENGKSEESEITFKLDRSKAMGHILKRNLNHKLKIDDREACFDTILATPTKTVIKGSLQGILGLGKDYILGERYRPNELNVQLIADGIPLPEQGGGMSTDSRGITFHQDYDALPANIKQLQLKLVSAGADHDVREQIELEKGKKVNSATILGQKVEIAEIYEEKGDTCVTITTNDSVILTRVHLWIDGKKVELRETRSINRDKLLDGTITHTRTLHFPGIGDKLTMDIERMTYSKVYNKTIEVPLD